MMAVAKKLGSCSRKRKEILNTRIWLTDTFQMLTKIAVVGALVKADSEA